MAVGLSLIHISVRAGACNDQALFLKLGAELGVETKGGTMRLGKYPCTITPGTRMAECYGCCLLYTSRCV